MMKSGLFLLFLSLFLSCASRKSFEQHTARADSLQVNSKLTVRTVRLPESSTTLRIPIGELESLPSGATFRSKDGTASASVRSVHDTLYITATCDSLQQVVYKYRQQIERISSLRQNRREESKRATGFPCWFLLGGCIAGVLVLGHCWRKLSNFNAAALEINLLFLRFTEVFTTFAPITF